MSSKQWLICACLGASAGWSSAADPMVWMTVGDPVLQAARGGFENGAGLMVSLGVERMVSINGVLVSSTSFNIADVSRLSVAEASQARTALGDLNLVQNGAGNIFLAGPMQQAMGGTVIQNSLNDQVLQTQTMINTSVNSLNALKLMNFQDSLQNALGNVVGVK